MAYLSSMTIGCQSLVLHIVSMGDYLCNRLACFSAIFRLELNRCSVIVTICLMLCPIGYLTFTGAIRCTSASAAVLCFAAFHFSKWNAALSVVTNAHLGNVLHFIVHLIQAGAGDAMPEEFDKRVHISEICIFYFDQICRA